MCRGSGVLNPGPLLVGPSWTGTLTIDWSPWHSLAACVRASAVLTLRKREVDTLFDAEAALRDKVLAVIDDLYEQGARDEALFSLPPFLRSVPYSCGRVTGG